jgi:hypothetical protein
MTVCPCCAQPVDVPPLDQAIVDLDLPPMQARILDAIWKGRGLPVQTGRIFDAMYADDPEGGPEPSRMYNVFKVMLWNLRNRLEGSGIAIENVGYRQGYRLAIVSAGK